MARLCARGPANACTPVPAGGRKKERRSGRKKKRRKRKKKRALSLSLSLSSSSASSLAAAPEQKSSGYTFADLVVASARTRARSTLATKAA